MAVQGKSMKWRAGEDLQLGPSPENVLFNFGGPTNSTETPIRVHYKLEGYDDTWHEGGGEMYLMIRFSDPNGDQVGQKIFKATGESAGWSGASCSVTFAVFAERRLLRCPSGCRTCTRA